MVGVPDAALLHSCMETPYYGLCWRCCHILPELLEGVDLIIGEDFMETIHTVIDYKVGRASFQGVRARAARSVLLWCSDWLLMFLLLPPCCCGLLCIVCCHAG